VQNSFRLCNKYFISSKSKEVGMKRKNVFKAVLFTATCAAIISCGTTSGGASAGGGGNSAKFNSGVSNIGEKTTVVDWTGRLNGGEPVPAWLASAENGNFTKFMDEFQITGSVCRVAVNTAQDLRAAQDRAQMAFARQLAQDLATKVNVKSAELARNGGMDEATAQAIETRTTAQSSVEISGGMLRTEFWKKYQTENQQTGAVKTQVTVYRIYVFPQNTWDQLLVTYLRKVIGEMPQNLKPEQKEVLALINEMEKDERHPIELSQKQAEQKVEAEKRMVDAQVNLMPAQQEAAANAELARINQEALTDRTRISGENRTAMVKAIEEGNQQKAAYLSGDPALQSAATIRAADAVAVNARALDMAAAILSN
jgi:hypothetical protein